jgi:hypothetical protein
LNAFCFSEIIVVFLLRFLFFCIMGVYTRMCFDMGVFTCMVWCGGKRIVIVLFWCVYVCLCVIWWVCIVFYLFCLGGWCLYPKIGVWWDMSGYVGCGRCLCWSSSFFAGVIRIYPKIGVYVSYYRLWKTGCFGWSLCLFRLAFTVLTCLYPNFGV